MLYDFVITPGLMGKRHLVLRQGYIGKICIVDAHFAFEPPFEPVTTLGGVNAEALFAAIKESFDGPLTIRAGHFPKEV
jgi:hypothetical protein